MPYRGPRALNAAPASLSKTLTLLILILIFLMMAHDYDFAGIAQGWLPPRKTVAIGDGGGGIHGGETVPFPVEN